VQELLDFGLGLGEIPRNLERFELVRCYGVAIPHRIPARRMLVHNHVQHKVDTWCREREFSELEAKIERQITAMQMRMVWIASLPGSALP
jgi:hypothetical protein